MLLEGDEVSELEINDTSPSSVAELTLVSYSAGGCNRATVFGDALSECCWRNTLLLLLVLLGWEGSEDEFL
jgi:hypothetical protein